MAHCNVFDCPRNKVGSCELAGKYIVAEGQEAAEVKTCAHKKFKERNQKNDAATN